MTIFGEQRTCGCEDTFVNASERVHVCFFGDYEDDRYQAAISTNVASVAATSQECETCPIDVSGDGCLECADGVSSVSPGFTIPTVQSVPEGLSRRALQATEVVTIFRCHIELDLAIARCAGSQEPPCLCA
eukprot:SAG22_NODE_5553_length_994_cov_1.067039_1_plen_130_part_10